MSATPRYYVLLCFIVLLHQVACNRDQYTPSLLEDLDESSILNLLISDRGSVILFYPAIEGASPPPIMDEFNKLAQMLGSSGLEIDLFYHPIESTSPMIQSLKIKDLPCIKLIVNGRSYEYAGKKTAGTLFQDIERQFYKNVVKVSNQKKLESLLNGQRGLIVYFDNDSRDPAFYDIPDISLVRRVFENLVSSWSDHYLFVIAKDVKKITQFEDFEGKNGDIVVFRKHYPFYLPYTDEIDPQFLSLFLRKNTLPKISVFDEKLHNFVKDKRVACMLLIAQPKDADIDQILLEASSEIGDDIILAVYYDDKEGYMRQKLQRLIGSAAPFLESQIYIIDHRTGLFKYYKMENKITKDNIVKYYGYWKNNELKSLLRSELLPPKSDDTVEKLVGRNYLQRVMVPEYDAYVVFHFEACGEACDRILSMLQSIASQFSRFRVLKFFIIDLALNDIPDLQLEYIPSFGVYLRNDKVLRIYKEETISFKKMTNFINEWSKLLTKEEYEALEREVEGQELDRLIVSALSFIKNNNILEQFAK